ncbi:LOW QUALITY PROTEIN: hypothetical protein MXB_135, partial [Myxobolus squamalis]
MKYKLVLDYKLPSPPKFVVPDTPRGRRNSEKEESTSIGKELSFLSETLSSASFVSFLSGKNDESQASANEDVDELVEKARNLKLDSIPSDLINLVMSFKKFAIDYEKCKINHEKADKLKHKDDWCSLVEKVSLAKAFPDSITIEACCEVIEALEATVDTLKSSLTKSTFKPRASPKIEVKSKIESYAKINLNSPDSFSVKRLIQDSQESSEIKENIIALKNDVIPKILEKPSLVKNDDKLDVQPSEECEVSKEYIQEFNQNVVSNLPKLPVYSASSPLDARERENQIPEKLDQKIIEPIFSFPEKLNDSLASTIEQATFKEAEISTESISESAKHVTSISEKSSLTKIDHCVSAHDKVVDQFKSTSEPPAFEPKSEIKGEPALIDISKADAFSASASPFPVVSQSSMIQPVSLSSLTGIQDSVKTGIFQKPPTSQNQTLSAPLINISTPSKIIIPQSSPSFTSTCNIFFALTETISTSTNLLVKSFTSEQEAGSVKKDSIFDMPTLNPYSTSLHAKNHQEIPAISSPTDISYKSGNLNSFKTPDYSISAFKSPLAHPNPPPSSSSLELESPSNINNSVKFATCPATSLSTPLTSTLILANPPLNPIISSPIQGIYSLLKSAESFARIDQPVTQSGLFGSITTPNNGQPGSQ